MKKNEKKRRDTELKQLLEHYDMEFWSLILMAFKLGWNLSHKYNKNK